MHSASPLTSFFAMCSMLPRPLIMIILSSKILVYGGQPLLTLTWRNPQLILEGYCHRTCDDPFRPSLGYHLEWLRPNRWLHNRNFCYVIGPLSDSKKKIQQRQQNIANNKTSVKGGKPNTFQYPLSISIKTCLESNPLTPPSMLLSVCWKVRLGRHIYRNSRTST